METKTNLGLRQNETSAELLKNAMLYDLNQRHIELPPEAKSFANSKRPDIAIVRFSKIILSKLSEKPTLYNYLENMSSTGVKHHELVARALRDTNLKAERILH
nr:hypothetical protein [Candidatus Gracilibacteria bacterium]